MKKFTMALAALAVFASASPAHAQNNSDVEEFVTGVSLLPARVIGLTTGAALGVPIATVRATAEHTASYRDRISGSLPDSSSPANKAYSTMLALPAGLLTGLIDGPYYGCINATKGFDHPFSAESMSVTDESLTD